MEPVSFAYDKANLNGDVRHTVCVRIVVVATLLSIALTGIGCANVHIPVRNDTGAEVEVSICTDGVLGVAPGDTFHADGVPQQGDLLCLVSRNDGPERCVAIPSAQHADGAFPLSRARPSSKCP